MRTVEVVLIVEDNAEVRAWLEACVHTTFQGCLVVTARNMHEARHAIAGSAQHAFDLALIDIGLPDGNGIELIARAKDVSPACACIVTTIYDDDEHLFHAIEAGADGYLLKYHDTDRLIALLGRILDGEPPLSPSMARRVLDAMQRRARPVPEETAVNLTPREREVLALLGKGLQLSAVAAALAISQNTASSHVKSIYRKLNISNRAEAAHAAIGQGLIDSA